MDTSSTRQSLTQVQAGSVRAEAPPLFEVGNLPGYASAKRSLDFIASLCLLIAMSPLMALIALAVRLSSPGPVIFKQRRVGRDGNEFVLFKYRTMVIEAPTLPTAQMQQEPVSYYTRVGQILRRSSLDELPQLWNVLIGEMSLIGPRPSLPSQVWLNTRRQLSRVQELRPGITGWAQVSGRDDLSDAVKVAFDAEYRAQCSFYMDCRIAFLTIKAVISGNGSN